MSISKFASGSMEEALAQLLAGLLRPTEPRSPASGEILAQLPAGLLPPTGSSSRGPMGETLAQLLAGLLLSPDSRILRLPIVLHERGDRSRSAHYQDIKNGLFTPPISLGARAVGWPAREVAVLNAARIAGKTDDEIRALVVTLIAARKANACGRRP